MPYIFNPLLFEGLQKEQVTITTLSGLLDVDPSGLIDSGRILVYNHVKGMWETNVNISTLAIDVNVLHKNVSGEIASIANKAVPISTDYLVIEDSEDLNSKKSILISSLPYRDRIQDIATTTYVDTDLTAGCIDMKGNGATTTIIAKIKNSSDTEVFQVDGNGNIKNNTNYLAAFSNAGSDVTAIWLGTRSIKTTLVPSSSLFIGAGAGTGANQNCQNSVIIGRYSGNTAQGTGNNFLGNLSGYSATSGGYCTYLGYRSGYTGTTGARNIFIGSNSGYYQTTGSDKLLIGSQAYASAANELTNSIINGTMDALPENQILQTNAQLKVRYAGTGYGFILENNSATQVTQIDASGNIFNNANVVYKAPGTENAWFGTLVTHSSWTNGGYNTIVGVKAGSAISSGFSNVIVGNQAGISLANGAQNTIVGRAAGYSLSSGIGNTTLGTSSGYSNSGGSYNVHLGMYSGSGFTGSSNVTIGYYAGYRHGADSNIFIVDNQDRTSKALEISSAMLYGVFNTTVANQTLKTNAQFTVNYQGVGNALIISNNTATEVFKVDYTGITTLGDSSNYVQLSKEKGIRYVGGATVWKDMITDLVGRRLYSAVGTINYNFTENSVTFSPSGGIDDLNDTVHANHQINHEFKVGTGMVFYPHIHWWQQVTSNTVKAIVYTLKWRLQRNGLVKETAWNTMTAEAGTADDEFDFTALADGLYNQITSFGSITITCGISDILQLRFTRTDAETGDVEATSFDIHGEVDSSGSDSISSKTY